MTEPTRAQQRILDFIQAEVHAGRPIPTLREIAERFGFRSHRAAACHLEALKRKGFIESEPGQRPVVATLPTGTAALQSTDRNNTLDACERTAT
jgi:repressor LexA